jgi:hypothetical protein
MAPSMSMLNEAWGSPAVLDMMRQLVAEQLAFIADIDPSNPLAVVTEAEMPEAERYDKRNKAVMMCVGAAAVAGYKAGYRFDPETPDWPVAYIELPSGQVAWHLPQHTEPYDLHSTGSKYARIRVFIADVESPL